MYHTYRDVHPQRSNIEPVVLKYSIGVRKFYASWVKTFLPLSPHSEYKLHRAFSTTAVSLSPRHLDGDLKGEVERGKSSVSSSIAPRELSSCDSSGIPEERRPDRFRWLLQTRSRKKSISLSLPDVNHQTIYLNFSETRYRFLTRIRNTLRHFRRFAKRCTMSIDVLPRERYVYPRRRRPRCEIRMMRGNDTANSLTGCYNFLRF